MRSTCRNCHGEGYIITTPCRSCKGLGVTMQTKRGTVNIPAGIYSIRYCNVSNSNYIVGVSDGQTLRVLIDGTEVLATLNVEQSRQFRRDGFDVYSDVTISFTLVISLSLIQVD